MWSMFVVTYRESHVLTASIMRDQITVFIHVAMCYR